MNLLTSFTLALRSEAVARIFLRDGFAGPFAFLITGLIFGFAVLPLARGTGLEYLGRFFEGSKAMPQVLLEFLEPDGTHLHNP